MNEYKLPLIAGKSQKLFQENFFWWERQIRDAWWCLRDRKFVVRWWRDEARWDEMRRDETRWDEMRRDETKWDEIRRDKTRWDERKKGEWGWERRRLLSQAHVRGDHRCCRPLGPLEPSSARPGLFGLLHTNKGLLARSLPLAVSSSKDEDVVYRWWKVGKISCYLRERPLRIEVLELREKYPACCIVPNHVNFTDTSALTRKLGSIIVWSNNSVSQQDESPVGFRFFFWLTSAKNTYLLVRGELIWH